MTTGRELRTALSNFSLKALSLGLERGCRLLVTIAAAPVLGQAAFGRFAFASTVTVLLALGTDLGLGLWTTRALARDPSDAGRGAGIVRTGLTLRSLAAVPYAAAVAAAALLSRDREVSVAISLLAVAALANAYGDHVGAILRGYERFADEARLNAVRAVATALAGGTALIVSPSLAGLCAGLAAAAAVSCASGLAWVARRLPSRDSARRAFDRTLARIALRQAVPIWIGGLLSLLYFKIDTLFVRALSGDAELGAYAAAYKFFEGAHLLPAVVLAVAFPALARAHADPSQRRRLERLLTAGLLALGLVVGAACFFGGSTLVAWVFGPHFVRAVDSLRVLALGIPLLYLNFGLTHFLVARDRERATTWLSLLMLGIILVLDLLLIPRAGGPGAALATVLAEIALSACCLAALATAGASARTRPSAQASPRTDPPAA
jgi:O-antigen/teichoic acid export membrane protein